MSGNQMDGNQPGTSESLMPGWLAASWPRVIRLLAQMIAKLSREDRAVLLDAIDTGDVSRLEFYVDDDRRVVIFGFANLPLAELSYEQVLGPLAAPARTH